MVRIASYGVFGNPIVHSLSPVIHSVFARQTHQSIIYRAIKVPETSFAAAVKNFANEGGLGANVTLPFKQQAFDLTDQLTERAKLAGAVNTLSVRNGMVLGDNTDGAGLCWDLQRCLGSLTGSCVLLIGAGGAARGAVGALFAAGVSQIIITNRTFAKAQQLAQSFSRQGSIHAVPLNQTSELAPDIVINSTSSSLFKELPGISTHALAKALLCYDMFYQKDLTCFLGWAQSHNADLKVADGLGMLLAQAAESFFIWRGVKPDLLPVMTDIREGL